MPRIKDDVDIGESYYCTLIEWKKGCVYLNQTDLLHHAEHAKLHISNTP